MPIKAINMLSVVLDSEKQTVLHDKGYKVVPLLNQASLNGGSGGISPGILTFGTIGECDGPTLYPGNFTSGELSPGKHWRGVSMDPRACLDTSDKTYVLSPLGTKLCLIARAVAKSLSCLLLYIIILQKVRETSSWVQHGYSAGNSAVIVWKREGVRLLKLTK
jgi:hypothetical protein